MRDSGGYKSVPRETRGETNKVMASALALVLLFYISSVVGEKTQVSVCKNEDGELILVDGAVDDAIVTASFENLIDTTGWSFLEVKDQGPSWKYSNQELAKAAGMAEGAVTADLILKKWKNTLADYCPDDTTPTISQDPEYCAKFHQFLADNHEYMQSMIEDRSPADEYWYQVELFLLQLEGLQIGYLSAGLEPLTIEDLFMFQIQTDLDAIEGALSSSGGAENSRVAGSRCSALIKVLPGNSELFVTHDTWDQYNNMLRTYKLYDLSFARSGYNPSIIAGHRISFSSYPGCLYSTDDFSQMSSKLVSLETTIGNYNEELWKKVTPCSVLEGIRSAVANRLATSGADWGRYFSLYNSGTYNNQWMIVDFNLFERGQSELRSGLLWVLEQLPGIIVQEDQTQVLRDQSYWPSYNVPFYNETYYLSGFEELRDEYGDWYSYDNTPRALIFERDHCKVTDMESLIHLMKYNDFENDPLSACNCTPPYSAANAIASRGDLNQPNGTYPISPLEYRLHGMTDNKATCSEMMEDGYRLASKIYSGPTHQEQPPFQWSKIECATKPLGHPDLWNFETVDVSWCWTAL